MSIPDVIPMLETLNRMIPGLHDKTQFGQFESLDTSELYSHLGLKDVFLTENWKLVELYCIALLKVVNLIQPDTLISVNHTGIVRSSCRKLLATGVLPLLPFSIPHWPKDQCANLSIHEKNCVVEVCMRVFIRLLDCPLLRDIIKSDIGSIMAGLFYMMFYVKPPPKDRDLFKKALIDILDGFYQPDVIRNLMILHCCKGANGKICAAVRKILVKKMMQNDGVLLLVTTVLTEGASTCDIMKLSQLIVNNHPLPGYFESVLPQILSLLDHKDKGCRQVGSQCFLSLKESNSTLCETYLTKPLVKPLIQPSSETEVDCCLQRLLHLFASTDRAVPPWFVGKVVVKPLFQSYCSITNSVCHLKQTLKSLILQCIENALQKELPDLILNLCFPSESNVSYALGDSGGMKTINEQWIPYLDDPMNSLLDLISGSSKLKSFLYSVLLEKYSTLSVDQKLIASNTLSTLSTDPDVLKYLSEEPSSIIGFINILLQDKSSDKDTLLLGLVILNIIMNDKCMNKKRNWKMFDPLVEPLKNLRSKSSDGELRVLADDILNSLLSKGISGASVALPADLNSVRISEQKSDFETAMTEVVDAHLPVRAHAIRQLGKLLLSKDNSALKNKQNLFALFKENLLDSDSYMYLSCIEALSCAASEFPDEVLNILCDQFNLSKNAEARMKIGEVLLKTVRNLGEMAAVYKKELVHTFLVGCRDDDHLMRASSLSNLGELCKILSFRVGPFVVEIFECIQSIFDFDRELEPRRAAVMVVSLLLKGLGSDIFSVLESMLLEMYRKLKSIYATDSDDIIKLHAQIALEELEVHTRALIFPEQNLTKKISILDI